MLPPASVLTRARTAIVCPGVKLTLDARGGSGDVGNAVKNPPAVGLVTVRLRATACIPAAGSPPAPATLRVEVWPGPRLVKPWPVLVSMILAGGSGRRRPAPPLAGAAATHPSTSATRSIAPGEPLNRLTFPFEPSAVTTRFGTVWPGTKLRLEANGRQPPEG